MVIPQASVVVPQAPMVVARDFYGYLESFNIRYSDAGSDLTLRNLIHFHLETSQDPCGFCESLAVEISAEEWLNYCVPPVADVEDVVSTVVPTVPQAPIVVDI
ncbi:hypothetical protein QYF36_025653 [Acer negundo]|nr:hypothetical protein QYF36_025653 [Acer negundo]